MTKKGMAKERLVQRVKETVRIMAYVFCLVSIFVALGVIPLSLVDVFLITGKTGLLTFLFTIRLTK